MTLDVGSHITTHRLTYEFPLLRWPCLLDKNSPNDTVQVQCVYLLQLILAICMDRQFDMPIVAGVTSQQCSRNIYYDRLDGRSEALCQQSSHPITLTPQSEQLLIHDNCELLNIFCAHIYPTIDV